MRRTSPSCSTRTASSLTVQDDGRGIPVDKHPQTKTSALEVIFTTLHAGGKFEGQNYKTAGGLHGVGASVVNALSRELVATVRRDGSTWEQRFKQGRRRDRVKKIGPARGTGTTVFFRPDPTIFPKTTFDAGRHSRSARGGELPAQGPEDRLRERGGRGRPAGARGLPARRGHRRLPEEDPRGAQGRRRARGAVCAHARARGDRPQARRRVAVDGIDRRAHPQLRQRHPHRIGRHARERPAERHRQGDSQLHRHAQPRRRRASRSRPTTFAKAWSACSASSSASRSSRDRRRTS